METSQPFTVSRNTIFKSLVFSPSIGWPLWAVLFIGLILTALGCFYDINYIILALIVCLTVLPAMAFFLFVKYMFATEMVANLIHHTIERHANSYVVHILRPAEQSDPLEKGKEWIETGRLTLFDSNIIRRKTTSEYEVLYYKDSLLDILYIPRY